MEVNSTVGFTLTQRYQIVTLIYLGPQLRADASNLSLGNILTFDPFLPVSQTTRDTWYIYEEFLI